MAGVESMIVQEEKQAPIKQIDREKVKLNGIIIFYVMECDK